MERRAFNVEAYSRSGKLNRRAFVVDLANVSLEASENLNRHESVVPVNLKITTDGRVVNPDLDSERDIQEYFLYGTELDKLESQAGEKMRESYLNGPIGELAVWISPPGGELNYLDGRMTVGWTKEMGGQREIEAYGIIHDFNETECVQIVNKLSYYSGERRLLFDAEELRGEVLTVPFENYGGDVIEFLRAHVDLTMTWGAIADGEVHENHTRAAKIAQEFGKEAERLVGLGYSPLYIGAMAERHMRASGYNLSDTGCGILNSSLIDQQTGAVYRMEMLGGLRVVGAGGEKFVRNCPFCHRKIMKVLSSGFKCSCGEVYRGVC